MEFGAAWTDEQEITKKHFFISCCVEPFQYSFSISQYRSLKLLIFHVLLGCTYLFIYLFSWIFEGISQEKEQKKKKIIGWDWNGNFAVYLTFSH